MADVVETVLEARSHLHPGRIDLSWSAARSSSSGRPRWLLVRRRHAFPVTADEGICVADTGAEPGLEDVGWVRTDRLLGLGRNATPEGCTALRRPPLQMAEMSLRRASSSILPVGGPLVEPHRVTVGHADPSAADGYREVEIDDITRVERSEASGQPWDRVRTWSVYAAPGGGTERLAGRVVVSTGGGGPVAGRLEWSAPGEATVAVDLDGLTELTTEVLLDEEDDPDADEWTARITVRDAGLDAEVEYYYALFEEDPSAWGGFRSERAWRASAMATGSYGLGRRLYELLPAVHRQLDEAAGERREPNQLRRFVELPGAVLDQARSLAEGLRGRHDIARVGARVLPCLARWIGWDLDLTLDELAQRREIRFAPKLFRTVGSVPNLRAQVNRLTGWDCRVKEFAHNVFLSNAPETVHLSEIWEATCFRTSWGKPRGRTRTEGFDGGPAAAFDAGGAGWLFWHGDRAGRRQIWLQSLDEGSAAPYPAALNGSSPARETLAWIDESPAVVADGKRLWLFWSSNRNGRWEIWGASDDAASPFEEPPADPPTNLTGHEAEDRHPAAVIEREGKVRRLWLFWQSNRRGPTDIWYRCRVLADGGWEDPRRLTSADAEDDPAGHALALRHEMPAAAIDGQGRIWLFYCADLGDRRSLRVTVREGDAWTPPEPTEPTEPTEEPHRDEAPAAAFWNGRIWLFWHSDRSPEAFEGPIQHRGPWQILGQRWIWTAEGPRPMESPFPVTGHPAADKEPAALAAGPALRLFWRSQRRGLGYRSRAVDFDDPEMVAQIRSGGFEDRTHYTCAPGGQYARDAVGVYITVGTEDQAEFQRQRARVLGVLEDELPVNVRARLCDQPAPYIPEVYSGLSSSHVDAVPEWTRMRSWSELYTDHHSVNFAAVPIETRHRTWHIGLRSGD